MSRYCGETETGPILEASARWREVALLGDGSVFTSKHLWTDSNLTELNRFFIQNMDESDRQFLEKLHDQLEHSSPSAKQLAAEMMWLMYLCPSSLKSTHKREVIQKIWSWSGEPFPQSAPMLADDVLSGIGSAGPGYNLNLWRELVFFINFMQGFRRLPNDERKRLLEDGWAFADWLRNVPDWQARQLRHMLLFMLFPDEFERIFGQSDRRTIAQAFSGKETREVNKLDPVELDRLLREIRKRLESEYGTSALDYYTTPLLQQWSRQSFAEVTKGITATHVRQAIAEIERDRIPTDAESTGYDLIESGRRYPPKYVLSLAAKHANGEELDRSTFSGGEDTSAFRLLRSLGFEIEPKEAIPDLLTKFLEQAKAGKELATRSYPNSYCGLEVKVGFGKGNIARIPWIAFLAEGQAVPNGIYPVFLMFREENVLLLCYGLSETNVPIGSWGNLADTPTVQAWFNKRFGQNPDRYGASYVRAAYELDKPLPMADIGRELDLMIDQYKKITGLREIPQGNRNVVPPLERFFMSNASLQTFREQSYTNLNQAGLRVSKSLLARFGASLLAKRFLILTGLSGSGKTKLAHAFASWLTESEQQYRLVAVGADWTTNENVVGYQDALHPNIYRKPSNGLLEVILRAAADAKRPYLLILDEMNLSHVERYFADILSAIETRQEIALHSSVENLKSSEIDTLPVPSKVSLPKNLFIIGTVNVDETTYMFSPKVLDRANVIEFRATAEDISAYLDAPSAVNMEMLAGKGASFGEAFVAAAALEVQLKEETASELKARLEEIFATLVPIGAEFGFRTAYEITRFTHFHAMLTGEAWQFNDALDAQVLQKLMPKLHGSQRRLEPILKALEAYCITHQCNASLEKIHRMQDRLKDGFTSFAEA